MTLQELRAERKRLADQADELLTKARNENRDLLGDEDAKFDEIHADIEKLRKRIEREERQESVTAELNAGQGRRSEPNPPSAEFRGGHGTSSRIVRPSRTDTLQAMRAWFLAAVPDQELTADMRAAADRVGINLHQRQIKLRLPNTALQSRHPEDVRAWQEHTQEERAQSVGTATAGGFTVPDETMRELEVAMLAHGGMRQAATVLRTDTGADLPFPTSNDTSNEGVIVSENTAVTEQDLAYAQMVLQSFKYSSKMLKVSVELLQDNAVNVANHVGRALGERIGRITNRHFTVGTGASQPNGLMTAAVVGKTGAAGQVTTIIYDDLVDLEHSVDPAYRASGSWMMHDQMLKTIKKLKDSQGRPLWVAGLAVREPDTILGYPYVINQHVAVPAASARSLAFGALNKYQIRDVRDILLIRLDERFAELHQVAFLAFSRHDGDLLDAGTNPVKVYAHPAA